MTTYNNPFRYRASEQQRDLRAFLIGFGPAALNMLPEAAWDRLVVFRSAPGAGKTSLMRVFTAESVRAIIADPERFEPLRQAFERVGGIAGGTPRVVGALLNLDRDYRSLVDLAAGSNNGLRLFFRLLDARIMVAFLKATLTFAERRFPEDLATVSFRITEDDPASEQAAARLGGLQGELIYERCRAIEQDMLTLLDSLLPVDAHAADTGHSELHALRLLSNAETLVDGKCLGVRPLVMLDDGHRLHPAQRTALLERLGQRTLNVARWYAERYEALSHQEVLDTVGSVGRDLELVELENIARGGVTAAGRVHFPAGQFEKMLLDIGDRRAFRALQRAHDQQQDFSELIEIEDDDRLGENAQENVEVLRQRVLKLTGDDSRYREWLQSAESQYGYAAALRWRELEVLVLRDRGRRQGDLFEDPLTIAESRDRSSASIREAAARALARELDLPYYGGSDHLTKLGSRNVEQFLSLCGDLFAEMLGEMTLQRTPKLSAKRQDRIVRRASQRYWREIPRRVPEGHLVQRFVLGIIKMAELENAKPNVPYPPAVTGTALFMSDRERLLDPRKRPMIVGADLLLTALSNAISYNIVNADLDRSSKHKQVMIIYLNRMLCPYFKLPLGRGGYREKKLEVMAKWMTAPVEGYPSNDPPEQLSF